MSLLLEPSHPTWVRGLKHDLPALLVSNAQSHPTWVRGLKQEQPYSQLNQLAVAPYVGAWIETAKGIYI